MCLYEPRPKLAVAPALNRPLHPHKKKTQLVILVLIGVKNIRAPLVQHPRNPRHQPLPVRAINQ